jgi:hypothetical protein
VKKFEKVLNEFEFKSLVLVVFEKQKKKKKTLPLHLFGPAGPWPTYSSLAAARLLYLLFLFLADTDMPAAPVGASLSSCLPSFLCFSASTGAPPRRPSPPRSPSIFKWW